MPLYQVPSDQDLTLKLLKQKGFMMEAVVFTRGVIRKQQMLFIRFTYEQRLIDIARPLGAFWSAKHRVWSMPVSKQVVHDARSAFGRYTCVISGGMEVPAGEVQS